jgi:hypothetical protein
VKNARHKLFDVVDFVGPALLIGVRRLKCILLGSTWPYLVQRASVPVMVARRRLWRAARAQAHLALIPAYFVLSAPICPCMLILSSCLMRQCCSPAQYCSQ